MNIEYHDKVFAELLKIEVGKPMVVAKTVRTENIPAFLEATKMAIDLDWTGPEFYLDFDNNYTEVRKHRK